MPLKIRVAQCVRGDFLALMDKAYAASKKAGFEWYSLGPDGAAYGVRRGVDGTHIKIPLPLSEVTK